ncbi:hypothetical protein [Streptomyces sp. NPDC060188]|uniref:hypothetical protein n=1 Tax=Streptomyces sp. NPDC060188 TaxID=3347068 RepID=UPI0036601D02
MIIFHSVHVSAGTPTEAFYYVVTTIDASVRFDGLCCRHGQQLIVQSMLVLGVNVGFGAGARGPGVAFVELDGERANPVLVESGELRTGDLSIIDQIGDLARKFSSLLSGMKPDVVVIRVADVPPRPSRKASPRHRLMIEGALAYVCAEEDVRDVFLRNGKEVGEALNLTKDEAMNKGKALDARRAEAAAAALSGLPEQS